jgi:cytochrome c oxidase assembly protein subunit 15
MTPLLLRDQKPIAIWLAACALLIIAMVMLGGYTRLSGSGLSITTWKPIHGSIPPLDDAQWLEEFDAYKASPQYQKVNMGMSLDEFKSIFWPEFLHRLLGRLIGMVFFIPLIIFSLRRSMTRSFTWRLVGIFALGGLQGLMGWLMVKSGLVDMPRVSHLRLAAHLGLALLIFSLILWALLDILQPGRTKAPPNSATSWYKFWLFLVAVQLLLGAFMAGLRGGLIYNTYPTMDGQWIPDGILSMSPIYINFIENIALVQFMHRTLALLVAGGFLFWWYSHKQYVKNRAQDSKILGRGCIGVALIIAVQFTLGVLTLLYQSPLMLALLHQIVAVVLLAYALMLLHIQLYPGKEAL